MSHNQGEYSKSPLYQRLILLIAGFTNFIMGFALYYTFKDDKSKEWQLEFIQRGSMFGFCAFIIVAIILLIEYLINLIA